MELFHVLLLSVVEGITEFLPISSTGHLILTSHIFGISESEFTKTFEIFIQLGAIAAVAALYTKTLLKQRTLIPKLIIAFIPAGIIGFLLYSLIRNLLLENVLITLSSLFWGGVALILIELYLTRHTKTKTKKLKDVTYLDSFFIGCFQMIAIIPGVSRSASSIFGGLFMKLDRTAAVEFSFLLALPTIAAASLYDLYQNYHGFSPSEISALGIGFIASFIVALVSIKWLLSYIQNHSFIAFGVYRIVFSLVYFLLFVL